MALAAAPTPGKMIRSAPTIFFGVTGDLGFDSDFRTRSFDASDISGIIVNNRNHSRVLKQGYVKKNEQTKRSDAETELRFDFFMERTGGQTGAP